MFNLPSSLIPLRVVAKRTGRQYQLLWRWVQDGTIVGYKVKGPGLHADGEWLVPAEAIPLIDAMPRRRRRSKP